MSEDLDRRIAERAHAIWEEEGRPDGKSEDHWQKAKVQLTAEGARSAADFDEEFREALDEPDSFDGAQGQSTDAHPGSEGTHE